LQAINAGPDYDGKLHEINVKTLLQVGEWIYLYRINNFGKNGDDDFSGGGDNYGAGGEM
jgi:hypothetical protein